MNSEERFQRMLSNAQKMEDLGETELAAAMRRQARMCHDLNTSLDRGEKIYRVGPQDRVTRRALFLQYGMKMGR